MSRILFDVFCFQVEHVSSLTMSRVSAAASVKLTAKHLHSVVIEDSTFQVACEDYLKTILMVDSPRFFLGLVFSSTTPLQYCSPGVVFIL